MAMRLSLLLCLAPFACLLATTSLACSSGTGNESPSEGADTGAPSDGGPDLDPPDVVFDSDDPFGRVLLLNPYHLDTRCSDKATAIGYFDSTPDGKIAPCLTGERCYVRKDGVVFYAPQDCIHGTNFLMNVDSLPYSDLGPCEPAKHVALLIRECPVSSCTWARDVTVDVSRGCATAITSKGCRDDFGAPTQCFCDSSGHVFVAADPKSSAAPPSGFAACASSSDACKKALALVDTAVGCPEPSDAGVDAGKDADSDAADASDASDASDAGVDGG